MIRQLIQEFKKLNSGAKLKRAQKYGFNNPDEYLEYLKDLLSKEPVKEVKTKITKIHCIDVLDNSGSMQGEKFNNAFKGLLENVDLLKQDKTIEYTYSLYNFDNTKPTLIIDNIPIKDVVISKMNTNNGTPLYSTICAIKNNFIKEENVQTLIKIFTDGQDEHSSNYYLQAIESIKYLQENGVTITFVGTKKDVKFICDKLKIDSSNTLVHDNTSKGVKEAFDKSLLATQNYATKVSKGEDVSTGFYKELI